MNILLTGGTGYIGSAILTTLIDHGHGVTAIVRSEDAAATVTANGATAIVGDVTDIPWFTEQLRSADAAIHAAVPGEGAEAFDRAVATAVVDAFAGTAKPYIHTGGIWAYGTSDSIGADSPHNAPALVAWRGDVETIVLDADVAATVIEPGIVYGHDRGLATLLADGTLIGDGTQHWVTVHVDDLAELYRLVIESGSGHGYVVGSGGENPTVRQIAEGFGAAVVASTPAESRERLGADFADALLLDQQADGAKARGLGWVPSRPGLLEELSARV